MIIAMVNGNGSNDNGQSGNALTTVKNNYLVTALAIASNKHGKSS